MRRQEPGESRRGALRGPGPGRRRSGRMPHPLNVVAAFVAEVVGTLLTLAALVGVRRGFPRAHMAAWSWAWGAGLLREVASFLLVFQAVPGGLPATALRVTVLALAYVHASALLLGADEFARG